MDKLTTAGGVQQAILKFAQIKYATDCIRKLSDYCASELADITNGIVNAGKENDTESISKSYKNSRKLMEKFDELYNNTGKLDKQLEKLIDLVEMAIRENTFT